MSPTDPDGGSASLTRARREWRVYMALSTMPDSGSAMRSTCRGRTAPVSMVRVAGSHACRCRATDRRTFSARAFSPLRRPSPRSKILRRARTPSSLSFERAEAERAQLLRHSVCALPATRNHRMQTADLEYTCFNPCLGLVEINLEAVNAHDEESVDEPV